MMLRVLLGSVAKRKKKRIQLGARCCRSYFSRYIKGLDFSLTTPSRFQNLARDVEEYQRGEGADCEGGEVGGVEVGDEDALGEGGTGGFCVCVCVWLHDGFFFP